MIDHIYTSLDDVKEEIHKRWQDKDLRKKLEDFFGKEGLPDYLFEKPHAISIEDIATPNLYCWTFIAKAHDAGLEPLHLEYLDDIFVTINHDKSALGKMGFYHGLDNNGDMIKTVERLIDSSKEEKKKLKHIMTHKGESLVDFHHKIFFKNFPNAKVHDGSEWFAKKGGCAKLYYKHVLAMAVCHGVLFENFLDYDYESDLVQNIMLPAFAEIEREFGYRPLIVAVAPTHEVLGKVWLCYPEFIKTML
jgi:hypothetical protein